MTERTPQILLFLAAAAALASPLRACASDASSDPPTAARVVNIDTPATPDKGQLDGSVDVRFLGGRESLAFGSVNLRYGVTNHLEAGVRAVTGFRGTTTANNGALIRFGGRDTEIYGKYGLHRQGGTDLALIAGLSFPATPAQHNTSATLGASGEIHLFDRLTAYVNPRAVFLNSNTLFGVGVGGSIRVTNNVHLIGDWTTIASGNNTISTVTGTRTTADVWGIALRLTAASSKRHFDLDLGYGNGTGSTTGSSLTPGIGGSTGFYFALRARP